MLDINSLLAGLTLVNIFSFLILAVVGFFIGSSLKGGLKYAAIFIFVLIALVVAGLLSNQIMDKLVLAIQTLMPLSGLVVSSSAAISTFTPALSGFSLGFIVGFFRG